MHTCVLPHLCLFTTCVPGAHGRQRGTLDPLAIRVPGSCETPCPLEEQSGILMSESIFPMVTAPIVMFG